MNRTLAHDLLLLSLDEEGRRTRKDLVGHGVVGAVLAELALAGRLEIARKRVMVVNPVPVGNERLDTVLARIAADKPRKPQRWVEKLRKGLADQLIEDLTAAGVLRREEGRVLGFIHSDRYLQPDSDRPTTCAAGCAPCWRVARCPKTPASSCWRTWSR
ncbi:MAG TPA: GPP34 family phosphoprotein [Dermatophilaceae bacterium]|nr:GPP34 family phosphoprotein [Dermatophilaceae bacterium]